MMDYLYNQEKNLELYGEEQKREGIEQGIEIGKKKAQRKMAKKMKQDQMPIEEIMKYTQLSKEEIEQL